MAQGEHADRSALSPAVAGIAGREEVANCVRPFPMAGLGMVQGELYAILDPALTP
jgi:hypothetical protein